MDTLIRFALGAGSSAILAVLGVLTLRRTDPQYEPPAMAFFGMGLHVGISGLFAAFVIKPTDQGLASVLAGIAFYSLFGLRGFLASNLWLIEDDTPGTVMGEAKHSDRQRRSFFKWWTADRVRTFLMFLTLVVALLAYLKK